MYLLLPIIAAIGLRASLEHGDLYQYKGTPPLTSIIIPTYNEELYIRKVVNSILNQPLIKKYPSRFELVLVDSGSNDKTVKIAKPLVDRVILAPRGKLTGKDIGVRAARGNIIVCVDADLYFPPRWIDKMLRHYLDPEVVGVKGIYISSFQNGKGVILETLSVPFEVFARRKQMVGGNNSFRRKAYIKCGGYNLNVNQLRWESIEPEEEWLFPKRLEKIGKVVFDPSVIAYHPPRRMLPIDPQYTAQIKRGARF